MYKHHQNNTMSETNMETLLSPDVQMQLFEKAFDYIKGKHGEVNLQTCLHEMYSEELPEVSNNTTNKEEYSSTRKYRQVFLGIEEL